LHDELRATQIHYDSLTESKQIIKNKDENSRIAYYHECTLPTHVKEKTFQPCATQTQAYINRYDVLHVEEVDEDDDTKEVPLTERVEKTKTPTPILNDDWDQIDDFIRQNEEYYYA